MFKLENYYTITNGDKKLTYSNSFSPNAFVNNCYGSSFAKFLKIGRRTENAQPFTLDMVACVPTRIMNHNYNIAKGELFVRLYADFTDVEFEDGLINCCGISDNDVDMSVTSLVETDFYAKKTKGESFFVEVLVVIRLDYDAKLISFAERDDNELFEFLLGQNSRFLVDMDFTIKLCMQEGKSILSCCDVVETLPASVGFFSGKFKLFATLTKNVEFKDVVLCKNDIPIMRLYYANSQKEIIEFYDNSKSMTYVSQNTNCKFKSIMKDNGALISSVLYKVEYVPYEYGKVTSQKGKNFDAESFCYGEVLSKNDEVMICKYNGEFFYLTCVDGVIKQFDVTKIFIDAGKFQKVIVGEKKIYFFYKTSPYQVYYKITLQENGTITYVKLSLPQSVVLQDVVDFYVCEYGSVIFVQKNQTSYNILTYVQYEMGSEIKMLAGNRIDNISSYKIFCDPLSVSTLILNTETKKAYFGGSGNSNELVPEISNRFFSATDFKLVYTYAFFYENGLTVYDLQKQERVQFESESDFVSAFSEGLSKQFIKVFSDNSIEFCQVVFRDFSITKCEKRIKTSGKVLDVKSFKNFFWIKVDSSEQVEIYEVVKNKVRLDFLANTYGSNCKVTLKNDIMSGIAGQIVGGEIFV